HSASLAQLVKDVRRVMEPHTASNIKERKGNKLKDFVHVAGLLGVSHLVMFSTTESASGAKIGLRIGRMPRGPTLSFNVKQYVLTKDVQATQARPKSPGSDFKVSPLVVLNNFNDPAKHVKLMATMFQNMFPPINVQTMKLTDARRIILFNLDSTTNGGEIEVRHYAIGVKAIGLSKSVKTIVQTNIPDLNKFDDVSDYVLRAAFASESDVEDGPESTVTLPQKYVGRNNAAASQRAVKLQELGPRLQLRLVKITEGLCGGEVLHHEF
ncbi:Brix-domain-containing protein, partial [Rhizoclosmatium globosum]